MSTQEETTAADDDPRFRKDGTGDVPEWKRVIYRVITDSRLLRCPRCGATILVKPSKEEVSFEISPAFLSASCEGWVILPKLDTDA